MKVCEWTKSPSVIRCDKLGDYKNSGRSSYLTYSKPEAKEKLSVEAKPEVCRYRTYIHSDR